MKQPAISVIMSVYNAEQFLAEAVTSILHQSFSDFEFIIINDGSRDTSLHILTQYAQSDSRIKLVRLEKNLGLVNALNTGLHLAQGTYIARMDADDISLPHRLQIQYDFLEENPDIYLVGGSFTYIDSKGEKMVSLANVEFDSATFSQEHRKDIVQEIKSINHPTVMFRNTKDVFYREKARYCEDRDLWLRLITQGKRIYRMPDIVLKYRIHEKSLCTEKYYLQLAFTTQVDRWFLERLETGKDSYERFDASTYYREELKLAPYEILKIRTIAVLYSADKSSTTDARTYIKSYWHEYGFSKNKKLLFIYLSSFLPLFIRIGIREFLRHNFSNSVRNFLKN